MTPSEINPICRTDAICNEIERGCTQKDIARTYALAIKDDTLGTDCPDWSTINRAIIDRWSPRGLERVKKMAWDHIHRALSRAREVSRERSDRAP